MATVNIRPLHDWARKYPRRMWPGHPPTFTDGDPTDADWALAWALWHALDAESQSWYCTDQWPPEVPAEPAKPRGRKQRTSST
jgi:hypothetical protein